jgi:uncharacterized membrane protein
MSESASPRHLLVATFADEQRAGRALAMLVPALGHESIRMAAVVVHAPDGKVHFAETHDHTAGQGFIAGAGVGAMAALVGVLFTPLALLTAPIGGAIGAVVGKLRDSGFDDAELRGLGDDLAPGQSAVIVELGDEHLEQAQRLLAELQVQRVVMVAVDAQLSAVLDAEAGDLTLRPDA